MKERECKDPTDRKYPEGWKWPTDWMPLSDPDKFKEWIEDNKTC